MSRDETFTLDGVEIQHETDAAVLIELEDGDKHWLPLSQIEKITRSPQPFTSSILMTKWIALQKGLA